MDHNDKSLDYAISAQYNSNDFFYDLVFVLKYIYVYVKS